MKAAAFVATGRLEVVERPDPAPGPGEARIRVAFCGVCGSDLHEFVLASPLRLGGPLDAVMGHEFSGIVDAVGEGVEPGLLGAPVAVNPSAPCGDCFYCRRGLPNLCQGSFLGGIGYGRQGGYAEYVLARAEALIPLPGREALQRAALAEPLAVALHIMNRVRFSPGDRMLITGGGPIGLLTAMVARRAGASAVILSEPLAHRRALGTQLGADRVLDPAADDVPAAVLEATGGTGADIAVECSGAGAAIDAALASVRSGGRVGVAGVADAPHPVDFFSLLWSEKEIVGCLGYGAEFAEAARLLMSGEVDPSPLISDVVGLDRLPAVFAAHAAGDVRHHKVLVRPQN